VATEQKNGQPPAEHYEWDDRNQERSNTYIWHSVELDKCSCWYLLYIYFS